MTIITGDCLEVMAGMEPESVDSCVTDPPYGLGFMGKEWDTPGSLFERKPDRSVKFDKIGGNHNPSNSADASRTRRAEGRKYQEWCNDWAAAVYRVMKPGAWLLAFSGTRTQHRMVCAIEDSGFEIRDQIGWAYGSGFPKSLDVSKAIDKAAGIAREDKFEGAFERRAGPTGNKKCDVCGKWLISGSPCQCPRPQDAPATPEAAQWQGWGTALKPAWEPICVARKPIRGTVAANVLRFGTGALNIDATRIPSGPDHAEKCASVVGLQSNRNRHAYGEWTGERADSHSPLGRWPANICHDGSDEVLACFPAEAGGGFGRRGAGGQNGILSPIGGTMQQVGYGDTGSAARFFYCAKASSAERGEGNDHPTVKPVELMRWLVRLVTPRNGHVLDPFGGSGTTGVAAIAEGFTATLIERDEGYAEIARNRVRRAPAYQESLF